MARQQSTKTQARKDEAGKSGEADRQRDDQREQGLAARSAQTGGGGAGMGPFAMMRRMMDDMFGFPTVGGISEEALWSPKLEMYRENGKLVVRADVQGLDAKDLKVELASDEVLLIEGERRQEEGGRRTYSSFRRYIQLPEGIDAEGADARFENGHLEIRFDLPSQQEQPRRRIAVKTGEAPAETQGEAKPSVH
jgi:HSP20 family protein